MNLRILAIVFILMLIPLANASFSFYNSSIEKVYGPGESLRGWLNISFDDEQGDNELKAGEDFSGSIKLIDFLDENSALYDCLPLDCEDSYEETAKSTTKTFSLESGKEKILGLRLTGEIDSINSLSFKVVAENSASCTNPLEIDILDDNNTEFKSKTLTDLFDCGGGMGCFQSSGSSEVRIGANVYCEKIRLNKNKEFKIGAWVKGSESSSSTLEMEIHDLSGSEISSCSLGTLSLSGGEISCQAELDEEIEGEHYICIRSEENTYYKIKKENTEPCGFYGEPEDFSGEYTADYYIFAKGARYASVGEFTFNQDEYENQGNSDELASYIDDYLDYRYNKDCDPECIIPIRFKTYTNINIEVSNISLEYQKEGSPETPITEIYNAEKKAAKISTEPLILDLEYSGILTPEDYGEKDLQLYLNNKEILDEELEIEIKKVPLIKNILPKIVAAAFPTRFTAEVEVPSGENISEYRWDFGDETQEETSTKNYITHIYSETGTYFLVLEAEDESGDTGSKTFEISVTNPKEAVNSTLADYKNRLNNISLQISTMPEWYKEEIKKIIDLDSLVSSQKVLERSYLSSTTSEQYTKIMEDLLKLNIPKTIKTGKQGNMPFFVSMENINPEDLNKLGAGSYEAGKETEYKKAIGSWTEENLNILLSFKYILAYYDEGIENLLGVFNLKVDANEEIDELYILIKGQEIKFNEDYKKVELDNGIGIILEGITSKNIEFSIPDTDVESLVLYLSPKFSKLDLMNIEPCDFDSRCEPEEKENTENCRADCKPWGTATILLIILLFAGLIAYIVLQWWYKTKYEDYLFKNKNDLFNLVNFIKNAENQGISDYETKKKLKAENWTGEQVNYAFKKSRGKSIMLFDFLKLFSKLQKEKLEGKPVPPGLMPRGFLR